MKKISLSLFLLCSLAFNYYAQNKNTAKEVYSVEELKQDFAIFRDSLEEGHPALYRYKSKAEMDAIFEAASASITKELSDREFMLLLCKVVAQIGDGHLRVVPPKVRLDKLDESSTAIPFQVYWSENKLYVKRNYSTLDDKEFVGAQIISINEHSIEDFLKDYLSHFSSDGNNITNKYRMLERPRFLTRNFYILYGYTESYQVAYLPPNETTVKTAKLQGLLFDNLIEIQAKRYPTIAVQPPTDFNISAENQSAYLRISSFDKERLKDAKTDFPKFLKNSFKSLEDNKIKNLILDLRGNGGGTDEYGKLLFSYFINQPFDYYESLRMNKNTYNFFKYTNRPGMKAPDGMLKANSEGSFDNIQHPNIGKQTPSLPTFTGNIYVLINGACFSTTSEFLSLLHFHTKAVFIGEESGGGYYGNSSGPTPDLKLPNTQVRVEIPLMKYAMAVKDYQYADRGLVPNYTVIPTIKDKLENRDLELEFAKNLIRKQILEKK